MNELFKATNIQLGNMKNAWNYFYWIWKEKKTLLALWWLFLIQTIEFMCLYCCYSFLDDRHDNTTLNSVRAHNTKYCALFIVLLIIIIMFIFIRFYFFSFFHCWKYLHEMFACCLRAIVKTNHKMINAI